MGRLMNELVAFALRLGTWFVFGALAGALLVTCAYDAKAAVELPECNPAIPQPPFVFVLPDGYEVAVTRWEYQLDSRRVVLIGNDRVFCDGLEGEGL